MRFYEFDGIGLVEGGIRDGVNGRRGSNRIQAGQDIFEHEAKSSRGWLPRLTIGKGMVVPRSNPPIWLKSGAGGLA